MAPTPSEIMQLVERVRQGHADALNTLLGESRDRLRRMVQARMDRRLQARVDADDVVQEAFIEATERIDEYFQGPEQPFFLWLRFLVGMHLIQMHRRHLGAQMRDAGREISLYRGALPEASSAALAAQLLGKFTSPTHAAVRAERALRLQEALNSLETIDREILSLRHVEQLSRAESAQVLDIDELAAAKRYFRALKRLREVLAEMPGGLDSL
jgi:RNA polymerase sigma-70 factor (ECF subfamily)